VPIDVGIAVENVGRLVDAIATGEGCVVLGVMPAFCGCGQWLAQAEDALESFASGGERVDGEFETFQANDCPAMAFDDGILAVPIGAAEVAADDQTAVFDALHDLNILETRRMLLSVVRTSVGEQSSKKGASRAGQPDSRPEFSLIRDQST
jgi:hypothetical protein